MRERELTVFSLKERTRILFTPNHPINLQEKKVIRYFYNFSSSQNCYDGSRIVCIIHKRVVTTFPS